MEEKKKFIIYKGTRYTLNRGYYKTTYGLHRRIWEDHFGEIPADHHIHHKNGDTTDNSIENLECIHKTKHHSMHFSAIRQVEAMQSPEARLRRREWRRSEEGRKASSAAGKKQWSKREALQKCCVICHQFFTTKNYSGTKYCSIRCRSQCQTLRETIEVKCFICEKKFKVRQQKNQTRTCSQECKGKLISWTKNGGLSDSVSTTYI